MVWKKKYCYRIFRLTERGVCDCRKKKSKISRNRHGWLDHWLPVLFKLRSIDQSLNERFKVETKGFQNPWYNTNLKKKERNCGKISIYRFFNIKKITFKKKIYNFNKANWSSLSLPRDAYRFFGCLVCFSLQISDAQRNSLYIKTSVRTCNRISERFTATEGVR